MPWREREGGREGERERERARERFKFPRMNGAMCALNVIDKKEDGVNATDPVRHATSCLSFNLLERDTSLL